MAATSPNSPSTRNTVHNKVVERYLLECIVDGHPELRSGARLLVVDDLSFYELKKHNFFRNLLIRRIGIEHEWDFVGRRLARYPRPTPSTDGLWVRLQDVWNAFSKHKFKICLIMPRRLAALIAARGAHIKY